MNQYTLLVADDHKMFVDGIQLILGSKSWVKEVKSAFNGYDAVETAANLSPDCMLMDINMPGLNGIEATRKIKSQNPAIPIIIVSMQTDAASVAMALDAGANGFVNKNTSSEELSDIILRVIAGERYISGNISISLLDSLNKNTLNPLEVSKITPREKEIIQYIVKGFTNQEIATNLFLSSKTVETHRKNILSKLNLKNTASLVRYAMENKLHE